VVRGYEPGGVRQCAVGDHLDLRAAAGNLQLAAEVLRNDHDAADAARDQLVLQGRDVARTGHSEPPGVLVGLSQAERRRTGVLQCKTDARARRIQ
jgi:hypothetical protein